MRVLVSLVLIAAVPACSKSSDRRAACEHLIDLAKVELEKNLAELAKYGDSGDIADRLRGRAESSTRSDLETCVAKLEEHDLDPACIAEADTLDTATACLRRDR